MTTHLIKAHIRLAATIRERMRPDRSHPESERGDVPGWVLITIMTAAIVTALWAFAVDKLPQMFEDAINSVKS